MSIMYNNRPIFLADYIQNIKFKKYMFIRKGGSAIHKLGDISRDSFPVELICVSNEDEENWIGNYAEGFGFFGVRFKKDDCRAASDEEVDMWLRDKNCIEF